MGQLVRIMITNVVIMFIFTGIFNDLGSGGNVDVCVLSKSKGVKMLRNYRKPNERKFQTTRKPFPRGSTAWLKNTRTFLKANVVVTKVQEKVKEAESEKTAMDTSA